MPESVLNIKGSVGIIKPTDNVLTTEGVRACTKCGDTNPDNRAVRPWGFQGAELYCTACGTSLGQIGG